MTLAESLSPTVTLPRLDAEVRNKIYAGVLGKIIGVYLGRPVEGWSRKKIADRFGEVTTFVNAALGLPIVLPDDDISGTFAFFRALEDNGYPDELTAHQVGQTWLNYIIEEKTILWWGGLGRSTEHTAFLRLKSGIEAPASGSHTLNGPWIPEQIGAEIFMDAFAMACPGDPERAVRLVRAATSVSHDGLAVEAATLLAAMEALAFIERDVDTLLDAGLSYVGDKRLRSVIDALRERCTRSSDWEEVFRWIAANHSYDHYDGPCHMIPNHAIVLMALLMGGDDFSRALTIAVSAGWDTDCNAGNVGCLNGIRLGLGALDMGPDLRGPVADFLYVVNADGASGITDAVQETRRIVAAAAALRAEPAQPAPPRFAFEFPGSRQGFAPCPRHEGHQSVHAVGNANLIRSTNGLEISLKGLRPGVTGSISTPVFVEPHAASSSFAMLASPTLYPGQTVVARLSTVTAPAPTSRLFALHYDRSDRIVRLNGDSAHLRNGENVLAWKIPDTNGMPLYRVGIEFGSDVPLDGRVILRSLDWKGAPDLFEIRGMLMDSIWNLTPFWTRAWVSSACHLAPDFKYTLCISHPEENGVVTTGSRDWDDYAVSSSLDFSINDGGGLVARARGHRRYYAGILRGTEVLILRRRDWDVTVLASAPFAPGASGKRDLVLTVKGSAIAFAVDGKMLVRARDDSYASGGAGFLVNAGTIVADGFAVRAAR